MVAHLRNATASPKISILGLHREWNEFPNVLIYYRVGHKFSYTWNELFVMNWFISKYFCGNTKSKILSSPHYLEILINLSKPGLSYSVKHDPSSISKITFYASLRVSPIDAEFWWFFLKKLFKTAIPSTEWGQLDGFIRQFCKDNAVLWRN